jgi:hypothetical protein
MWVVDALAVASRFAETVQAADEWLARFPRHNPAADSEIGFSAHCTSLLWRGYALQWMGRLQDGLDELGRCRRLLEEDETPELAGYALMFAAEGYRRVGDAKMALASARGLDEVCRKLGEFDNMVAAVQRAFCNAHLAAGRADDALEAARISIVAAGQTEAAWRAVSAVLLSDALLLGGDLSAAETAAGNAITLCRNSLRAPYEAEAQGVLARALLRRDGRTGCEAAETALTEAAALIESSGAVTLAPALCEWRAELAEVLGDDAARKQQLQQAHDLYREIGASAQAERLASELADPRPAT